MNESTMAANTSSTQLGRHILANLSSNSNNSITMLGTSNESMDTTLKRSMRKIKKSSQLIIEKTTADNGRDSNIHHTSNSSANDSLSLTMMMPDAVVSSTPNLRRTTRHTQASEERKLDVDDIVTDETIPSAKLSSTLRRKTKNMGSLTSSESRTTIKIESTSSTNNTIDNSQESVRSTRPKRKAAPVNLIEPKLTTKMRRRN